jgi:uncharacterized membrane protein YgcG
MVTLRALPPSSLRYVIGSLGLGAALSWLSSPALADPVVLPQPVLVDAKAKIINISAATQVFYKSENLRFTVLRAAPGTCAEVRVTLLGQSRIHKNVAFPWTFQILPNGPMYPTKNGKYEVTVEGVSGCSGKVSYTFAYNDVAKGVVTDVQVIGFDKPETAAARILGHGVCRLRVATYKAPYAYATSTPGELVFREAPVALPITVPLKRSGEIAAQWGGDYVIEVISMDNFPGGVLHPDIKKQYPGYEGCTIVPGPGSPNAYRLQKTFSTVKSSTASNTSGGSNGGSGNAGGGAAGGGGSGVSEPKPANGKIVSMLVPGGSFAEDEAQKIQVNGQGGCGFDLTISNKSYGGSYEQTFPVTPQKLDGGATLYNGTHFGTLAEGSWKASTTGKNGCTGSATIDFKVTPKTSTKKVAGKPTIAFDQQPKSGGVFMASKDGNIWFKVTVPQSVKDEPYATCCDVEFDYVNEYGGWQPLPNSPFSDSSYALAVKQANAVVPKSVAYFSQGTHWRMKVRASKYKTEFDWSDWIEFKVDQH